MVRAFSATRRHFLSSTSLAYFGVGAFSNDAESQETVCDGSDDKKFAYQSQQLPEPKIVLPTDSLPVPQGPRKRVAAITTTYFKYSHADDIITKFIEGYGVVGRTFLPHCDVVSMYVEQFPETDIGRGMAARYGIPLFDTPSEALTMDGSDLAVDAVLPLRLVGVFVLVLQARHVHGRSVWQGLAGLALEHCSIAWITGVQGKNPIHRLFQ